MTEWSIKKTSARIRSKLPRQSSDLIRIKPGLLLKISRIEGNEKTQRHTGTGCVSVFRISRRRFADFLLFGVTSSELAILFILTPAFTLTDWIYVLQHTVVLGIALTRGAAKAHDRSLLTSAAVVMSYGYPYAQVIYLNWVSGEPL